MLVKETPARNLRKRYCYRISQNGSLRRQWPDSCRNSLVEILARSNSRGFKRRAPRWGRVTGEYRPRHLTGSLQRVRVFHAMRRLTCARVNGSSGPFDRWQSNWDLMCLMECAFARCVLLLYTGYGDHPAALHPAPQRMLRSLPPQEC